MTGEEQCSSECRSIRSAPICGICRISVYADYCSITKSRCARRQHLSFLFPLLFSIVTSPTSLTPIMISTVQSIVDDATTAISKILKAKVLAPSGGSEARAKAWHEAIIAIMGQLVRPKTFKLWQAHIRMLGLDSGGGSKCRQHPDPRCRR